MKFKDFVQAKNEATAFKQQTYRKPIDVLKAITQHVPSNLLVCSFTKINKLGVNPNSKWKTPIGIYSYPMEYVMEQNLRVPFMHNAPFIQVCQFVNPQKILQMHGNPQATQQNGLNLLDNLYKVNPSYEELAENIIKNIKNQPEIEIRSNYSLLWVVTRKLANGNPVKWNQLLRYCSVDGFVDNGTGTIHPNEPTQCVVFEARSLKVIHTIDNLEKTDLQKRNLEKYKFRQQHLERRKSQQAELERYHQLQKSNWEKFQKIA